MCVVSLCCAHRECRKHLVTSVEEVKVRRVSRHTHTGAKVEQRRDGDTHAHERFCGVSSLTVTTHWSDTEFECVSEVNFYSTRECNITSHATIHLEAYLPLNKPSVT